MRLFLYKLKNSLLGILGNPKFKSTSDYWENRYKADRNSGSGSYGQLAEFKKDIINNWITKYDIKHVLELGCGDGNQLVMFNFESYIGYDVSSTIIDKNKTVHANDTSKQFVKSLQNVAPQQLSMSLDVIYHLVEDATYLNYMESLFKYASDYVIVYSSNFESENQVHVKHHKFTDWIATNKPEWKLIEEIPNKYPFNKNDPDNTTHADFFLFKKMH